MALLKGWILAVLIGLLFMITSLASADDVLPPDWRGEDRTVFAEWTFDKMLNSVGSLENQYPDNWSSNPSGLDTPIYRTAVSDVVFHESYGGRQSA